MELLSFRKYAAHRGVSGEAVSKAVRTGRISVVVNEKGQRLIDPAVADKEWAENTYHNKRTTQGPMVKKPQPAPAPAQADDPVAPSQAGIPASINQSKAIKEAYEARIKKLDYEEKLGKLIDVDKVKVAAFKTGRVVRDNLLNIPNDLSGKLAAETDQKKIHHMLTEAITIVLQELARENKP